MLTGIRFTARDGLVVLQVAVAKGDDYYRVPEWRDAKVEDLLDVARYIWPQPEHKQEQEWLSRQS